MFRKTANTLTETGEAWTVWVIVLLICSIAVTGCGGERIEQVEKIEVPPSSISDGPIRIPLSTQENVTLTQDPDRFVAISVGHKHNCALQANGSVVCWGNNHLPRSPSRPDEKFIAISAGNNFTCALKEDGAPFLLGIKLDRKGRVISSTR